jgi:enamine deaminase RidA (YjgF/YER057c/UK114 family)
MPAHESPTSFAPGLFVVDIGDWEAIGRVHGDVFRDVRPASTMVQVARLIHPDHLVEIEIDAYAP